MEKRGKEGDSPSFASEAVMENCPASSNSLAICVDLFARSHPIPQY
jgi:hypothetical protein